MKLYHSHTSPYVRKVMILLHETDQLNDVEIFTSYTSPTSPMEGLAAKNPLMKLPALERTEGPTLYDSRVICAFLDGRVEAGLYGQGPRRYETMTLEATGDGILDAALSMTYETRLRPEGVRWDDWTEAQWGKIEAACRVLNTRWMAHLSGPLDMGQIAVACALAYVEFRHGSRDWRNGNDALTAWFEAFSTRDSFQATVPPTDG